MIVFVSSISNSFKIEKVVKMWHSNWTPTNYNSFNIKSTLGKLWEGVQNRLFDHSVNRFYPESEIDSLIFMAEPFETKQE